MVVAENLTLLIGTQAAQHMKLITRNKDKFVKATPKRHKQAEVSHPNLCEEVVQTFTKVFDRLLGTFSGNASLEVELSA